MFISDRHAGPAPAGPRSALSVPDLPFPRPPAGGAAESPTGRGGGCAGAERERTESGNGAGNAPGAEKERSGSGAGAGSGAAAPPSWVAGGGGEGLLPHSSGGPHFPWTSFCFCYCEAFPHHLSVPGPEARSSAGINQLHFPVAKGGRKMHSGSGHNLPCLETGPLFPGHGL
nr:collagen alpha-1(I) chain isoform X2 [Zonotrichia albicollis]